MRQAKSRIRATPPEGVRKNFKKFERFAAAKGMAVLGEVLKARQEVERNPWLA